MTKRRGDEERFEEAASAHPSRTTRTSLPPLVLDQDPNQLSSEDRVTRPLSPSPVTDGSGYYHATLKISSIASLAEHDRKISAAAEEMLNIWTLDHVWEETGREWEKKYKVTFPLLQDNDFRKMVQDHRSPRSVLEREWQDMWLLQIREWTATKFIAYLQKEGAHQRIRSWIETGVYHCESVELWEELLLPQIREPIRTEATLPEPKISKSKPEPSEPALPTDDPYGLWETNGRWGNASNYSSNSSANSVASIKDALQARSDGGESPSKFNFRSKPIKSQPAQSTYNRSQACDECRRQRETGIQSPPNDPSGPSPKNTEVSKLIPLDSRPYASIIQKQDRVGRSNNLDASISNPNSGRGKVGVKQTGTKDPEERPVIKLAVDKQEHQDQSDEPRKDISIIGRQTCLADIIKALTERGCQDLSQYLDLATFSDYPLYHGGFSDVYRGLLEGGRQVAVKTLRISTDSVHEPKHLKRAARELHTWSSCQHPNVLPLLGLAVFRGRIGMVSPWMESGNLQRYLNSSEDVDWCDLCTQICDGLAYLHKIGIIHGDLKGANVLVLRDGTPVLSDFGNAILLGRGLQFTETTQRPSWSIRWAAPELLHESDEQSEAADVYALGMTILEVMTGKHPYDGKSDFMVVALVSQRKLPERPEEHIPIESSDGNKLWELLERCWEYDPDKRPSAAEVTTIMGSIRWQNLLKSRL